ncbi:VTT domain-containing protein [Mycoplasmatota bacterium WC30]
MNWIYDLLDKIKLYIENHIWIAPLFSILLPFIEAIIPSLPLTAIIALSIAVLTTAYGATAGTALAVILSTLGSFLGMLLIFVIIRNTLSKKFVKKVEESEHGKWFTNIVETGNTGLMLTILSNPLLPSSILNYAISLTNIKVKKYLFLTLLSRIIIILFLVFLGSIFDIQSKPLNILWVMLTYSGVILLYGLMIKFRKKKNLKNIETESSSK